MSTRSKERVQALGEVFTAETEVNLMLDMLAGDTEDPECRILEPSCGNGNFLVEIVKRRARTHAAYDAVRNVFGIDICHENVEEARERVLSLLTELDPDEMSGETLERVRQAVWDNIRSGDFLKDPLPPGAVDVVVGNPPYQEMDGGFGASARPIYQKFVRASKAVARKKVCLIIPARWFTGGKGLDDFRREMLADRTIAQIVDWENSSIPFPGVDISGGICVVLMDTSHDGDCLFHQRGRSLLSESVRDLRATEVLIRDALGASIASKALRGRASIRDVVRPRNAFGMATNFVPAGTGDIFVLTNAGWRPHQSDLVQKRADEIRKWKVFVSGSAFEHAGACGKDGKRRVLSRILTLPPGTAATETYILIDSFEDEAKARRLAAYLSTKTVRYLVSMAASSHHITRDRFRFVPAVDLSREWDDDALALHFGLDESEKARVADAIRDWPENAIAPQDPFRVCASSS